MAKLSRYFETFHDRGRHREDARFRIRARPVTPRADQQGHGLPREERVALGLDGLLPPHVSSLEEQVARVRAAYLSEPTAIAKYQHLRALQERNELLFFAVLERHLAEMLPIIYTPTVGEAVQQFSSLYQAARGLSLSTNNIAHATQAVQNTSTTTCA